MASPKESACDAARQIRGNGGRNNRDKQSVSPPHTGLLREEVLVFRDLLGYIGLIDETTTLEPPKVGVPLPHSRMKDVLLVGLDIDTFQGYEQLIPDQQLHIGISLLDTRKLQALLDSPTQDPNFSGDVVD